MKKIGIIVPMAEEIEELKSRIKIDNTYNKLRTEVYSGKLSNKEVVLAQCGVGKVNAAACAQLLISEFGVDTIINTGVAGGMEESLEIGDVVISEDALQHDFDCVGFGCKPGEIPRMEEYIFKADDELIDLAYRVASKDIKNHKVDKGRILTGDLFVSNNEDKEKITRNFKGHCLEMEGGSIAQTCYLNNIPFVILRAISDKANGEAHDNFTEFVREVAINSSRVVEDMLKEM